VRLRIDRLTKQKCMYGMLFVRICAWCVGETPRNVRPLRYAFFLFVLRGDVYECGREVSFPGCIRISALCRWWCWEPWGFSVNTALAQVASPKGHMALGVWVCGCACVWKSIEMETLDAVG
jgi:hypothetical protein